MTTTWNAADVTVHRASHAETPDVLDVLDEAAAWLCRRGIDQWPEHFERAWIEDAIGRGETWLARIEGVAVGTLTLDWSDPLWADATGAAGYVHRMAVRRQAAGLGAVLHEWAVDAVRRNQRALLRLDCVASNRRIRAYYERQGFRHRGDVPVGGAPGQRRDDGPLTRVSRYERTIPWRSTLRGVR